MDVPAAWVVECVRFLSAFAEVFDTSAMSPQGFAAARQQLEPEIMDVLRVRTAELELDASSADWYLVVHARAHAIDLASDLRQLLVDAGVVIFDLEA